MKRRDLILAVSLELFNEEGEANLSAVDIANELDISPGNLYYHYKGKEEIISALFDSFEQNLTTVLQKSVDSNESLEDFWLYFYIIFEQIYSYRFFYRNLTDLLQKHPQLDRRFRRLLELQYGLIEGLLRRLADEGVIEKASAVDMGVAALTNNTMMIFTHWFEYQGLRNLNMKQHEFIQSAILQVMSLLAPYLGERALLFMQQCNELYQRDKPG